MPSTNVWDLLLEAFKKHGVIIIVLAFMSYSKIDEIKYRRKTEEKLFDKLVEVNVNTISIKKDVELVDYKVEKVNEDLAHIKMKYYADLNFIENTDDDGELRYVIKLEE